MDLDVVLPFQQVRIHRRSYDKEHKIYECKVPGCNRSYVQYPQLNKHYKTKHEGIEMPSHLHRPRKIEKHAKKGRPHGKINTDTKEEDNVQIDNIQDKDKAILLYENKHFCTMLVNLMFTSGYLSRNMEEGSSQNQENEKQLNQNQIIHLFKDFQKIFRQRDEEIILSQPLIDALEFISPIVYQAAFVIIYYSLFIGSDYFKLYEIAQLNSNIDKRFLFICELIKLETIDEDHHEIFQSYFNELRLSLLTLNRETS